MTGKGPDGQSATTTANDVEVVRRQPDSPSRFIIDRWSARRRPPSHGLGPQGDPPSWRQPAGRSSDCARRLPSRLSPSISTREIALGLNAGLVPPRVDSRIKAGLLGLIAHAAREGGWSTRRAAALLGLDHVRVLRWQARAVVGRLDDAKPGPEIALHALLPWEREAIRSTAAIASWPIAARAWRRSTPRNRPCCGCCRPPGSRSPTGPHASHDHAGMARVGRAGAGRDHDL